MYILNARWIRPGTGTMTWIPHAHYVCLRKYGTESRCSSVGPLRSTSPEQLNLLLDRRPFCDGSVFQDRNPCSLHGNCKILALERSESKKSTLLRKTNKIIFDIDASAASDAETYHFASPLRRLTVQTSTASLDTRSLIFYNLSNNIAAQLYSASS